MGGLHAGVFSLVIRCHECSTAEPQEAQQCSWLGKVWGGCCQWGLRSDVALYGYLLGSEQWITRFWMGPMPPRAGGFSYPEPEKKGIIPPTAGQAPAGDGLEVVYGRAGARPNTIAVREIWKQRHG